MSQGDDCLYCNQPTDTTATQNIGCALLPTDFTGNHAISVGDLLTWDTALNSGNGGVRRVVTGDAANTFSGVAVDALALHKTNTSIRVQVKNTVNVPTTPGEVYTPYMTVSVNKVALANKITNTNGSLTGSTIGLASLQSGVLSVTGGVGVTLPVLLVFSVPINGNFIQAIT